MEQPRIHISNQTIGITTMITDAWGGCEELWSESARLLRKAGYHTVVYKPVVHRSHPRIAAQIQDGVQFLELCPNRTVLSRARRKVFAKLRTWFDRSATSKLHSDPYYAFFRALRLAKPRLMLISQGINFDGMEYARICRQLHIPYVIISHKAVDFYWPTPFQREAFRSLYLQSEATYFVSQHNKRLTEEQFAIRLDRGGIVFNPIKSRRYVPYPPLEKTVRLCCVGRLFVGDKGQDILLRILSRSKWKDRPIHVTFVGAGPDETALRDLSAFLGVVDVSFTGFCEDMESIWQQHHALVLPSRCEGLPLTIIEAMFAGRPIITTHAGGNAELLEEGVTGFIGYAHEDSFEDALQRAWEKREKWEDMGRLAATKIASVVPASPEKEFVDILLTNHLCN